jgi:hypothetical protein
LRFLLDIILKAQLALVANVKAKLPLGLPNWLPFDGKARGFDETTNETREVQRARLKGLPIISIEVSL